MNGIMQNHTKKLTIRLGIAVSIFALIGSSLAALARYEQSLKKRSGIHNKISINISQMRASTAETKETVAKFNQLLPSGYGTKSQDLLIFSKIDLMKAAINPVEMSVTPPEEKEGLLAVGFTLKLKDKNYSALLNQLGSLETSAFPFISFTEISIIKETKDRESAAEGSIAIQGSVIMPVTTPANGATP